MQEEAQVSLNTYIDDFTLRAEGSAATICASLPAAAADFVGRMIAIGLPISAKSAVVATKPEISQAVVGRIHADTGLSVQIAHTTGDLGVDNSLGKKRVKRTRNQRGKKAELKTEFIKSMRAAGAKAHITRKLGNISVKPQRAWAAAVQGVSRTELQKRRPEAAQLTGYWRPGMCITSLFAITHLADDPAQSVSKVAIQRWVQYCQKHRDQHARIRRAWAAIGDKLLAYTPEMRWRFARGAVSAKILTLIDINWKPLMQTFGRHTMAHNTRSPWSRWT